MTAVEVYSLFTDFDIDLFKAGKHFRLYEKLGAHIVEVNGVKGTYFAVWAPAAHAVSVVGDFNHWDGSKHPLKVRWDSSGIWEGFIPDIGVGTLYKYQIHSDHLSEPIEKADPFARRCEHPPKTASVVWEDKYEWQDGEWMTSRAKYNALDAPWSVYEVHLGSWKKVVEEDRSLSYLELADELVEYVVDMGFTHVEFMPVMEYPYDPSWGYQITGYYAPSSRFGYPNEFKTLVDRLHQKGIGVILDWVPSHFPEDAHGLGLFDGTHLYEHPDRQRGYHPDWKSLIFNYGRNEVRAFLISNALFWLDVYHADGLRVDAVASMLYLDYSRNDGEWTPNERGGNENLEAISFIKDLNIAVYEAFPDVQTIAEESTAFSGVTRPTFMEGLGFGMKWMMGWMHDTLQFFSKDPIYRSHHLNDITFSLTYAFTENFMLPLSHDEVVHGKGSTLNRMPGDEWQRFANLRLLYGLMFTHPGTKLNFMGNEFAQSNEWNFSQSLDWNFLDYQSHQSFQQYFKELNRLYRSAPALYEDAFSDNGFEWICYDDFQNQVISYIRKTQNGSDYVIVFNFMPQPHKDYRIGLPNGYEMEEIFNSDQRKYMGSGAIDNGKVLIEDQSWNHKEKSAVISIPPLGMLVFELK